jgi:hypothetical protein
MPRYNRGSGSVYRRGKTWCITYYDEGKQHWESAETTDKGKARDKLKIKLGEIASASRLSPFDADFRLFNRLALEERSRVADVDSG